MSVNSQKECQYKGKYAIKLVLVVLGWSDARKCTCICSCVVAIIA